MFIIIEILRRQFFVTIIVALIGAYALMDQLGFGAEFKESASSFVKHYIPDAQGEIEKVKRFLKGL